MRTYTYVTDAIGAILMATAAEDTFGYYNVANLDNLISIRDLAKLIANLSLTKKTKVCYAPNTEQKLKYLPFKLAVMDTDKIKKLGWRPNVNINDTFRFTLESFL